MILTNAFSIQMLDTSKKSSHTVSFKETAVDDIKELILKNGVLSAIGHEDTASVLSHMLGLAIPANRVNIQLNNDPIIVAQIVGGRLPEGATTLPKGIEIKFFVVNMID